MSAFSSTNTRTVLPSETCVLHTRTLADPMICLIKCATSSLETLLLTGSDKYLFIGFSEGSGALLVPSCIKIVLYPSGAKLRYLLLGVWGLGFGVWGLGFGRSEER